MYNLSEEELEVEASSVSEDCTSEILRLQFAKAKPDNAAAEVCRNRLRVVAE